MSGRHYTLSARSPETGESVLLRLPEEVALKVVKNGPPSKFYELRGDEDASEEGSSVHDVLAHPTAVFRGVREH